MESLFPPTVIVRHTHENPRKCSVVPLRGRADVTFLSYPVKERPPLDGYVRLAAEGPPLTAADAERGLLLLDGSWRWAAAMTRDFLDVPPRSLHGWRTAYPRTSKLGTDPDNGLASIEALFIAYHLLGRPTAGLLDHYHWAEAFLQTNHLRVTEEGQTQVQRLVPELPFPPYSFVPGRAPHPRSDPAGHSFGIKTETVEPLEPARWRDNRTYLFGLDLFNAQFYWEAHEQFESLWLACGRHGVVADFLKGLIKLAAAGVKHREGRPEGVTSHAGRAAELFRGSGEENFLGLCVAELIPFAEQVRDHGWPLTTPILPVQGRSFQD